MMLVFTSSCEELDDASSLVEEAGIEVALEVVFDEAAELVSVEEVPVLPQPVKIKAEEVKTSNNAFVLFFIVFPPYFLKNYRY